MKTPRINLILVSVISLTFASGVTSVTLTLQPTSSPEKKELSDASTKVFEAGALTLCAWARRDNKPKSK